MYIKNNQLYYF